ncbi:MAG: response regulator transcription factor [Vitreoscilla sp.]|nr:response regulator transcription factor [Burkholderiales bacterium]MBP6336415.1 response regulator transcription factor [Vitreoscilla sp.]MBP6673905.1 response regulator transcription factor [Vitreoscilla sp.]
MTDRAPIHVALVEDDPGVRTRLARVINADDSLKFVYAASSVTDILAWLGDNAVDILLVDLGLPDGSGLDVIRRCRRMQPACAVLVVTVFGDERNMLQAFEAGAGGYILKDGTEADLANHVTQLHAGGAPMSPLIARQLLVRWQANAAEARSEAAAAAAYAAAAGGNDGRESLSPREAQVLDMVARGFTYAEVAQRMGLSLSTVRTHVRNIYGKLDVHNKTEAVFEARHLGLLR